MKLNNTLFRYSFECDKTFFKQRNNKGKLGKGSLLGKKQEDTLEDMNTKMFIFH